MGKSDQILDEILEDIRDKGSTERPKLLINNMLAPGRSAVVTSFEELKQWATTNNLSLTVSGDTYLFRKIM